MDKTQQAQERAAFEQQLYRMNPEHLSFPQRDDGKYRQHQVQQLWIGWQWRAALAEAAQPAAQELTDEQIRLIAEESCITFRRPLVNDEPAWFEEAQTDPETIISFARALLSTQSADRNAIRAAALEEAAKICEDTPVVTIGGYYDYDNGQATLDKAAEAIRAAITEQTKGGAA